MPDAQRSSTASSERYQSELELSSIESMDADTLVRGPTAELPGAGIAFASRSRDGALGIPVRTNDRQTGASHGGRESGGRLMDSVISMGSPGARADRSHHDDRRGVGTSVSLYTSIAEWGAARLRAEWGHILESGDDRLALFQSPEWFDHIHSTEPDADLALADVRDVDGYLIGLVPLVRTRHELEYSIRRANLGTASVTVLEIPGGVPPLPEDVVVYNQVFELLGQAARGLDGLFLRMVPTSSFCWRYLNESPLVRASFALFLPEGIGRNNVLELPPTFEEYMAQFKSRTRYNLRQRVKQLRERGGGELRLQRFEAPDEVEAFLGSAGPVARRSWQARCTNDRVDTTPFWRKNLGDSAERGLLRSYVLTAGSEPCAFVLGYQGRGTFHHIQIGYDPSLANFSPGSVLHYLMFEDLILNRPPRRVSFGYGDSEYKRMFGNAQFEEASVLLIRPKCIGRMKVSTYTAFRSLVRVAKQLSRRVSSSGRPPGEGLRSPRITALGLSTG
jgi:CelD/BcsL family acetyltransferase involved in cellulose biosynthesis